MVLCTYDSGQNGANSGPQTYTNMESVTETYSISPPSFPAIKSGIVNNCPSKPIANNNNSNDNQNTLSEDEKLLLAKLEEANRLIETDSKSLNSISGASGHSRRSSDTSQISVTSGASSGGGAASNGAEESEEDAWTLWGQIVNDWENYSKKKNGQLKELVRRGVPHHFRGIVWQLLCGAYNSPAKQQYAEFIKASSPCEKVIRRDIARTYPEHEFFKEKDGLGQESLFNVMKAYSLHDREVGYCQGSAFIVGLLLMQMPEEDAFAVFVKVMQDFRMREMFKPSMSELGLCMYQLESMVKDLLPELHIHFQAQSFHTSMYASSWFLTLFTTALPLQLACRIMDVFLSEGVEIIFRIAVAILMSGRDTLLQLDMEGMLKYFQKEAPAYFENDADSLMYLAFSVKYNAKKMKKLEKDYTVMKTKEHEEMVELRRLRTENRLLRQRIDDLEAETAMLADKLVQGQVSRAEEAESNFVIMRELAAIRQHDLETSQQLNEARERIQKLSCIMEENGSKESSLQEISLKSEIIQQKEELIKSLQEGLVNVRLREAENDALIRDLRARIQELEEDKKKLRETTPDNSVAHLQEELIAVKLREAESTLALKELRQKVSDLNVQWQKRVQDNEAANQEAGSSATKKLMFWDTNRSEAKYEEEIMSLKLRETEAVAELNELRHRVMELEAQMQVSVNQVKRAESELMKCREELDDCETSKRQLCQQLRDQERKYSDLESKMKEELMLARIRDAEHSQGMAELTQKISGLECKNQELVAEGELSKDQTHSDTVKELQDKIAELTAEVMRLKMTNRKLSLSLSVLNLDSPSRSSPDETEDELNFHFDDPTAACGEH